MTVGHKNVLTETLSGYKIPVNVRWDCIENSVVISIDFVLFVIYKWHSITLLTKTNIFLGEDKYVRIC
jgi:hypothetical protein